GDIAGPLIVVGPAGDRQRAVALFADGHVAWHLVANVAVYVGENGVLRRGGEVLQRLAELVEVLGTVDLENGTEEGVGFQRRPAQRQRILAGGVQAGLLGELVQAIDVGDERAVARGPDGERHASGALNRDRFLSDGQVLPLAVDLIL